MTSGICRRPYQILPTSGAKITCVEINDHGFAKHEWFVESMKGWPRPPNELINGKYQEWDFVLVLPWISVRSYWAGNDGMQAWRHRRTGYVVPDHCRQTGGCPEVWNISEVKGKRELKITNLEEIEEFVVLEHRSRSAFPEHVCQRVGPTSLP